MILGILESYRNLVFFLVTAMGGRIRTQEGPVHTSHEHHRSGSVALSRVPALLQRLELAEQTWQYEALIFHLSLEGTNTRPLH